MALPPPRRPAAAGGNGAGRGGCEDIPGGAIAPPGISSQPPRPAPFPPAAAGRRGGGRAMKKTVGSVVSGRETYQVDSGLSVRDAARYMTERRVGAVAVLDG